MLAKGRIKMSLMFCPSCGKQISGKAAFCTGCGFDLKSFAEKKQAENVPAPQNTTIVFPYDSGSICEVCGYVVDRLVPKCPNCKDGGRMIPAKKGFELVQKTTAPTQIPIEPTQKPTDPVQRPAETTHSPSNNLHIIDPVRNKALQHLQEDLICEIKGVRGRTMRLYPYKVMIRVDATVGSVLTANVFDGEKTIYFKDCVGIQFKKSGATIGYLQFETAASTTNNEKSNFFNENSFTFDGNNDYMQKVYEYVIGLMDEAKGAY